jgi:hypothetical protein
VSALAVFTLIIVVALVARSFMAIRSGGDVETEHGRHQEN